MGKVDSAGEIPVIRRARGYRLYTDRGRRLLDCYLNGGRAVLGHRPPGLSTAVKNVLERGLWAEYPSSHHRRLRKMLAERFPAYREIRVYRSRERAEAAAALHLGVTSVRFTDPALPEGGEAALWRPLLPLPDSPPALLLPVLPFPGAFAPQPLCFLEAPGPDVPQDDPVSPVMLEAAAKSLFALARIERQEAGIDRSRFDSPLWLRRGPYLGFLCGGRHYRELFSEALEGGILLPPHPGHPAVIPLEFDPGEIAPLLRIGASGGER